MQIKNKNNIKLDIKNLGKKGMNWIDVAQDMGWVLDACEYGHKPPTSMNHRELTD